MKKIVLTIMAVAAMAACTKSGVQYETAAEITFAPAAKNITKAALGDIAKTGTYPTKQKLGVYANYASDDPSANATVANYTTKFLNNVLFTHNTTANAWGAGESWPANGSLIFAGYAIPESGEANGTYKYDFQSDKLEIEAYTQTIDPAESFDLGWFNRTSASYNYRNSASTAVPVTLSHALAWVEIQVKGEGTTVGTKPWRIQSLIMNNVYNMGNAVCTGSGAGQAEWASLSNTVGADGKKENAITIYSGDQELTGEAKVCETDGTDVLVIPQTPTEVLTNKALDVEKSVATLTVTYTYDSPAGDSMPLQTTTVPLVVDGGWKSGYKYVYTLSFKANEILVAPSYNTWADGGNKNVIVE